MKQKIKINFCAICFYADVYFCSERIIFVKTGLCIKMTRKSVGPSTNQSKSEIYNSSAEFNNQNNNEKNDVKLPSKLDVIKNRIQKLARRASFKDFGGSQSLSSSLKDLSTIEEIIQQEPSDERTVYCNAFAQRGNSFLLFQFKRLI